MTEDERFMMAALAEARAAYQAGEIPIGAVVVANGQIIGRGHNLTEQLTDVTAHAEMMALTAAAQTVGGKYLPDATLYVTVEPCLMCAGAIAWAQVGRIVYGASDPKRGYRSYLTPHSSHSSQPSQSSHSSQPSQPSQSSQITAGVAERSPFHPKATITSGVLAAECGGLMKEFFSQRR